VGSGLGPIGVGWLHDQSDGYTVPFTITALLTYAAAIAVLFARPAGTRAISTTPPSEMMSEGGQPAR
jgi:cyanate permease